MGEEKGKTPFYKKWWFWLIVVVIVIGAFSGNKESDKQVQSSTKENEKITSTSNETEEKKKSAPIKFEVDVNEELNFQKFDVNVKKVKVYSKKDKILADVKLEWTNRAYDYGDQMTFFVATLFDVKQGEISLTEINDSWNPENKIGNDVFFPNAAGGTTDVNLTYELTDESTPIEIIFTPTTETEKSQTITVDLS